MTSSRKLTTRCCVLESCVRFFILHLCHVSQIFSRRRRFMTLKDDVSRFLRVFCVTSSLIKKTDVDHLFLKFHQCFQVFSDLSVLNSRVCSRDVCVNIKALPCVGLNTSETSFNKLFSSQKSRWMQITITVATADAFIPSLLMGPRQGAFEF